MKFSIFFKTKGVFWLMLGGLVFGVIILLAVLFEHIHEDWCSEILEAGHCERFPTTRACLCIDTATKHDDSIAVFQHGQSECGELNGSLAVPDNHQLLLWLSKKMFHIGINKAIVALQKGPFINFRKLWCKKWFWMHPDGPRPATNITWRPDVPGDDEDTNAVITVETREEQYGDDYYTYYNYDYYKEHNRGYQWYGFTTVADNFQPITGIFHICYYALEPSEPKAIKGKLESTSLTMEDNDPCECSSKEEIKLDNVEDSATFASPGYPNNYCSDNNCRWFISTQEGLAIELDWVVFSVENGYDFVFVYDGSVVDDQSSKKKALINTCTGVTCADQSSDTSSLEIHFTADHVTTDLGFKARVTAIGKDPCYCSSNVHVAFVNVHESYTFQSPRYPEPYCKSKRCSWTLSASAGNGIELSCGHFDLEQNDQLILYEGRDRDSPPRQLNGHNCESIISYSEDLHLVFESNDQESEHLGFSITATSIKNYCTTTIIHASIGSISFSDQRPDGYIPIGHTMTLVCPPNAKVAGTTDMITDQLICRTTGWHNDRLKNTGEMPHCVPVCDTTQLSPSPVEDATEIRTCKLPTPTSVQTTEDGHKITVEVHDCTDGCKLKANEYITCTDTLWQPSSSVCHSAHLTIMVVGGLHIKKRGTGMFAYEMQFEDFENSNMQMCNPGTQECILSKSMTSSDGQLFITNVITNHVPNEARKVVFKEIHTGQILPLADGSGSPKVQVLNGDVYECDYEKCSVYRKPAFKPKQNIAHYKSSSQFRTLVACGDALYALGGKSYDGKIHKAVDKYLPNLNQWESVASMNYKRYHIAATQNRGLVYACGGIAGSYGFAGLQFTQACECYNPAYDQWTEIASLIEQRAWATMVSVIAKLYLIGGVTGEHDGNQTLSIDTYDISENRWERNGFRLSQGVSSPHAAIVPQMPDLGVVG